MAPMKELAITRKTRRSVKRPVTIALAAAAIAALAGCTSPFSHASGPASTHTTTTTTATTATAAPTTAAAAPTATATQKVSTTDQTRTGPLCPGQEAWSLRAVARMKALYADTGALAADASANNQPAIAKVGSKLASDALAAATLPLPAADPSAWKTLTAAYVSAGMALAKGDASSAVPPLETGNSALSAFSGAVAKCLATTG